MAIVTIARELGALGEEVADELVRLTGLRILDRQDIEDRLGKHGLSPGKLQKFDERKPGLWASLSQGRDDYLHYLKLVVFEEAAEGDTVIVGRAAGAILRGTANLASVRITAPLALRVKRLMDLYHCDERRALQLAEHSDRERAGFNKYFFNLDWRDSGAYGLVVNTADFTVAEAAQIIDQYRHIVSAKDREAAGAARIADFLLGHRVVTEIAYTKRIAVHFLEADARGTHVTLHGVANTQVAIDAAVAAARGVSGVGAVDSSIQVVQEFSVMP